jgi:hypothetical protein
MRWQLISILLLGLSCQEKEPIAQLELCKSDIVTQSLTDKLGYTSKLDDKTWVVNYIDENCDNHMLQICGGFPDSLKTESRIIFSGQVKGTPSTPPTIPYVTIQKLRKCKFDCENDNLLIPQRFSCEVRFASDAAYIINSNEEYENFKSTIKCQTEQLIDFSKYSLAVAFIKYAGCCGFPLQKVDYASNTVVIEVIEKNDCKVLVETLMAFLVPKNSTETSYSIQIEKTIK